MKATFMVALLAATCVVGAAASASPASRSAGDPPVGIDGAPQFLLPVGGHQAAVANNLGGKDVLLYRGDGSLFAKRQSDAAGQVLATDYYFLPGGGMSVYSTYAAPPTARSIAQASHRATSCGNDAENATRRTWTTTLNWYWNQASTPPNLDQTLTLNALRNARVEWESVVDWCNFDDLSTVNFTYQGTTTKGYGVNGVNTVGWGDIKQTSCYAQNPNTVACTLTVWDGNGHFTEADTRFDAATNWANNGASGYYDVQGAMAHETGHAIGFDHVTDTTNVMYPTFSAGNTSSRELGKGDAREDNSWY